MAAQRPIAAEQVETISLEEETALLSYSCNAIPWFVRLFWIVFWCGAVAYALIWLLPALQSDVLKPQ